MMLRGVTNALRGFGGEFEINRVCGAFGTVVYILGAHAFVVCNFVKGQPFSLTEYCLAFPGGLAVCVAAIAGSVAVKDRNVAAAQVTAASAAPASPAAAEPSEVLP